jgi:hypothetical protein
MTGAPANAPNLCAAAQERLVDPASSSWLKSALQAALERDPVDALNDALVLAATLETHLRTVFELGDPP